MQQFFNHLESIHPISSKTKEVLQSISSQLTIKKGEDLQVIGNTCRNIYFVKSGILRIYYLKGGIDITESFEFENALVARADSLFDAKPSKKGIQALENTTVIAINTAQLFAAYDEHHDLERLFRKVIEQAYVKTVEKNESLLFHTAEERYQNLMHESAQIIQRVPLKHIASYLGITQVSLSRIRAKL